MSVLEPPNKRVLTGRRRGRPRSVIANGAPPESEATGLGHSSALSPVILHVLRPGSRTGGHGSGGGSELATSTAGGDVLQLDWPDDDHEESLGGGRHRSHRQHQQQQQYTTMGLGGALLCRALGAMGSLRRPPPIMATVPTNIPSCERRRRASVHVLDEFALYDHHRRCSQMPMSPSPLASPSLRLPTPPPPPTMPPPPPPPPSTAAVDNMANTTDGTRSADSAPTTVVSNSTTATAANATGQVTIQLTPSSPRCKWTSSSSTAAAAANPTPSANSSSGNRRYPSNDIRSPPHTNSPTGSASSQVKGRSQAGGKYGWSCAWSRRRRRKARNTTTGSSSRDDIIDNTDEPSDGNENNEESGTGERLASYNAQDEEHGHHNDDDLDDEYEEEDDDEECHQRRENESKGRSGYYRRRSSRWTRPTGRRSGSTAGTTMVNTGLHRRCSVVGGQHSEGNGRMSSMGVVDGAALVELEEVVGYGSECMAGVASAVIALLITAGVVYWLYAWQVGGVT